MGQRRVFCGRIKVTVFLVVLLMLSVGANIVGYFVARRFITRTVQFDELFENVMDDVDRFSEYFDVLLTKSTFSNSPDIKSLSDNMVLMKSRFEYYTLVFDGVRVKRDSAPKELPETNRPVVVD